jgi:hypothetical protein
VKVREAAVDAQSVARDRMRMSPERVRPLDTKLDSAWIALRDALGAKARLVGTEMGDRAAKLLPRVLPGGTDFVQSSFDEAWAYSENLLTNIDEKGLEPEISEVVGSEFVSFIRSAHRELGEGLGLGERARELPSTTAVAEANDKLAVAIANYGRLLVGWVDLEDPESVRAFQRAMQPLDAYRASLGGRGNGEPEDDGAPNEDDGVTDPIPPVGSDTPTS